MKNTREYTVNFAEQTITITKAFGKAASDFNTPEFRTMQKLMEEFKGFKFQYKTIKKNTNKKSYKGLTIAEMQRFVATVSENDAKVFAKVIALADTKQSKYAIVKKYFMNHYKAAYEAELEVQSIEDELADIEKEVAECEKVA